MEDDWGDWAAPAPVTAAAPQQQARLQSQAPAARQALDQSLFSALEEPEDEFGGFAAAPAPLPHQRADQQHHLTQQRLQQRDGQPPLAKGDPAWLLDGRTNAWVEARVVSIDQTVHPPSYGVELPDGSYRETEEHRLLPRRPGAAPPVAPSANRHHAAGPWAAAAASPFNQPAGSLGKGAAVAAAGPSRTAVPAAPAAAAAAGDEEDDFGDWAAAGAPPAPAAPAAALGQAMAAALAAPGSPRVGGTTLAAPSSAHGSPQRLPSRRSSAASSPVLDRFRSFLHAAAPQVSEQLELEEAAEEQQAAAGQQRQEAYGSLQRFAAAHLPPSPRGGAAAAAAVPPAAAAAAAPAAAALVIEPAAAADGWGEDDFGSFEAAEPAPPPPQQQQQPQQQQPQQQQSPPQAAQQPQPQSPRQQQQVPRPATAVAPKGVQRDAPLPLDLFGEEPAEEEAAHGVEPAAQPAAAVALAAQVLAPSAPEVAPAAAAAAVAAGTAVAAGGTAADGTAGTAADGSEWDDDFSDFVSSPPAVAAEAASSAVQRPAAAAAEQAFTAAQPSAAVEKAADAVQAEQHAAELPPVAAVQGPAAIEEDPLPLPASSSLGSPTTAGEAANTLEAWEAMTSAGAEPAEQPSSIQWDGSSTAAPAPPPPLPVPQQQPVSPSSVGSAGSRQSALLAALHPVSSAGSSARSSFEQPRAAAAAAAPPAAPLAAMLAAGPAAWPAAAGPSAVAGAAAGAAWPGVGEELVQEYAVAWARLLEATAVQLQASAALWAEAGHLGCWRELQQLPAAQQHMAACAQLYHAAAIVRLAAQQLGLLSLVGELQEAWAQVEAAWLSPAPSADGNRSGNGSGGEPVEQQEQQQQPAFREAALAAWDAASAVGVGSPAAVQALLQSGGERLEALSPDDFPRMLAWSEGLCGLTLLPLSLFESVLPVAPWDVLAGRPCLVPLANLWLHRVSGRAPQLD